MKTIKQVAISGLAYLSASIFVPVDADTLSAEQLAQAAKARTQHQVIYDGSYQRIAYPGGDVAADRGVCTDVVIRSYRQFGIDLQQLVHRDMRDNFARYPNHWGLTRPDTNIDHRRVPNLETFFTRHGEALPVTNKAEDYRAGDIVSWRLSNGLPHIGVVSSQLAAQTARPLIIHNIGRGPQQEDVLFAYDIVGHYRYLPKLPAAAAQAQ